MTSFEHWESPNLSLKETILRGIYNYGYETPSSIQKKAIIPIIKGRDIIAQSQSGTGKTGAYLIETLQQIQEEALHTQAVVLLPTRELAIQIDRYIEIKDIVFNHLKFNYSGDETGIRSRNWINYDKYMYEKVSGKYFAKDLEILKNNIL